MRTRQADARPKSQPIAWKRQARMDLWGLPLTLPAAGLCVTHACAQPEKSGVGNHFRTLSRRIEVFEPLSRHGPDALRVTVDPRSEMVRVAWTVELYPEGPNPRASRRRRAVGFAILYDPADGSPARPLFVAKWERLVMWQTDYEQLVGRLDAALARRDPWPSSDALVVGCGSPRYLIERRKHGKTTWLQQDCPSDRASSEIEDMLIEAFPFPLCWYLYSAEFTEPCKTVGPPGIRHDEDEAAPQTSPAKP